MSEAEREHHGTRKEYLHRCAISEACERDWEWLRTGKTPEITFETPELEAEIKKKRPHEIRTAERLVSQGVRADFVVDERKIFDEETRRTRIVGLPDLRSGIEIKTLSKASSYSTIDSYIKNASKKGGNVNALIFDNRDNKFLTDEVLTKYIKKSSRFKLGKVYMIGSNEKITLIR